MLSWSSSPTLQKIYQALQEQLQAIDQLRAHLEETLTPFQNHLVAQQHHIERSLEHLESRLTPLRQCVQGETENLARLKAHLEADLPDYFEAFERCLTSQRELVEKANLYIEEQPRPLQTYLEDERQTVETICRDLEGKLDRFLQNLAEQHQILGFVHHAEVNSEYDALSSYLAARQKAFKRYVATFEHRPDEFFAQLDEAAEHYKQLNLDRRSLADKVFEETRLADRKLEEVLPVHEISPREHTEEIATLLRAPVPRLIRIQVESPHPPSTSPASSSALSHNGERHQLSEAVLETGP